MYDRYGEEGLKNGGPPPPQQNDDDDGATSHNASSAGGGFGYGFQPGGGGGGASSFGAGFQQQSSGPSSGQRPAGGGYTYTGDPSEFFAQFTRQSNQRQRSYGETPFEGSGGLEEMLFGGGSDAYHGGSKRHRRSHVPERTCSVPCTLEDMYRGRIRKMKITRKSLTVGRPTEKILEVPIKPGVSTYIVLYCIELFCMK